MLQADQWLPILDASTDAGELKAGCGCGHAGMVP